MNELQQSVVTAELLDGLNILVEVRTVGSREEEVGLADKFAFSEITRSVEAIANGMSLALDSAKPDRAAVEFGLDIGIESGTLTALIAKGTGSATIKITLEWDRKSAEAPGT